MTDTVTICRLAAARRAAGETTFDEPAALEIARALDIRVPRFEVLTATESADFDPVLFGSDRVVVKALLPGGAHRTELGAVRVVPAVGDAVELAVAAMDATGADRFMVAEYVDHEPGPAGELLLGVRWSDAFGPVVTFGAGGSYVDLLAGAAPPLAVTAAVGDHRHLEHSLAASPIVRMLVEGHRGGPPAVSEDRVRRLLHQTLDLAAEIVPDPIAEFEFNPLVFTPSGPMALDAKARLGGPAIPPPPLRPPELIEALLHPRSIAIVGVSQRMNLGRVILRNLLAAGFPPDGITVVKGGVEEVDGCAAVAQVADLPKPVDLLVVSVDAAAAAEVVEQAAQARVARSVILIPGGLGERPGTEELARRIASAAVTTRTEGKGLVVSGPNSLGIRSVPGRLDTFFIPAHKYSDAATVDVPVAVVSQSGAFVLSRMDRLAWMRPRYEVSVGNQLDVTVGDVVEHLAASPAAQVIACYLEGFKPTDGDRFLRAVRTATAADKVVVLYAAGRTRAGVDAAASHTASVAGDHAVTTRLAAAAGAIVVGTFEEFEDQLVLATLLGERPIAGIGLGAVSNAGFETVAFADHAAPLRLADLAPATVAAIAEIVEGAGLGGLVTPANPLDVTPAADDATFAAAVAALLADPGVDVGVVGCVPFTPALHTLPPGPEHDEDVAAATSIAERLASLDHPTPWVAVVDAGTAYRDLAAILTAARIPVLPTADRAARALAKFLTR